MKIPSAFKLSTVSLIMMASPVYACSVCVYGMTWRYFPPVLSWSIIAFGWYIAQGVVTSVSGEISPFQAGISGSLMIALIAFVGAGLLLGPIPSIVLAIPPLVAFVLACSNRKRGTGRRWRILTLMIGAIALVAFAGTGIYDIAKASKMDRVDAILMWSEGLGRQLENEMEKEGRAALPEWRRLVVEGAWVDASRAARVLGEIGEKQIDVPLILQAYRHHGKQSGGNFREALSKLTGMELSEETPAEEWEKRWLAKSR